MTIETLTSLKFSFFIFGFLVFLILESFFPNRVWRTKRYKRLTFHVVFALFNTLIMRLPVLFFLMPILFIVTESEYGLLNTVTSVSTFKFILSLIVLDIAMYWWHRFNHTNPFLWKFHYVHHVDTHMDTGTSLRFHIGELILSTLYKGLIILIFGISISEFLFYEILLVLCVQFHHSNLKLHDNVDKVLSNKRYKKDIIDHKRINIIIKNIKRKSKQKNIDPKITEQIWKAMIKAYIQYEYRNFKK